MNSHATLAWLLLGVLSTLLPTATVQATAPPVRFWVESYSIDKDDRNAVLGAIAAADGAVLVGENADKFVHPKEFIDQVDVYWARTGGCHTAFKQLPLNASQTVTCLPGIHAITSKDNLILDMFSAYNTSAFSIIPESYTFPRQFDSFAKAVAAAGENQTWVLKSNEHRGRGVQFYQGTEALEQAKRKNPKTGRTEIIMAQRLVDQYLINNKPIDGRVYAIVSGGSPLRAYMFNGGISSFGQELKAGQPASVDTHVHAIRFYKDPEALESTSFVAFQNYLYNTTGSTKKWDQVWDSIQQAVVATIAAAAPLIHRETSTKFPLYQQGGLEVIAFDVLFDNEFKPWIIEVNTGPSLGLLDTCSDTSKPCGQENRLLYIKMKERFIASVLKLLVEKHRVHKRMQDTLVDAISQRKKQRSSSDKQKCIPEDKLKRVLAAQAEAAAAEELGYIDLTGRVYDTLKCMSQKPRDQCIIGPKQTQSHGLLGSISRWAPKRLSQLFIGSRPLDVDRSLLETIPYEPVIQQGMKEYDKLMRDWAEIEYADRFKNGGSMMVCDGDDLDVQLETDRINPHNKEL